VRVLILRTSALGDVVHALPVLTALRRHLPAARLGWVVEEAMAPLLAGHPDLDELLVARFRAWRHRPLAPRTAREVFAFTAALRRFDADVALELMGNHKGGLIAVAAGARRRIGLARSHRREPSSALWINEPVTPPAGAHAVDRALAVAAALGLPPAPADFGGAKLFAHEPPAVAAALAAAGAGDAPFVLVHPGAGWRNKEYPAERWGEVARRLRDAAGLPTLVTVAPGEEGLAAATVAAGGEAARAVAAPDLATLAGLLRRARLVLGGDTGPLHLAHALGTPALALFGPTDPARNGLYGAPERALSHPLPCSYCHKRLDGTKACLLAISPATVAERALAVLAAGPPGQPTAPA
jgi:lipopolysaccharide heptosyltransferase I